MSGEAETPAFEPKVRGPYEEGTLGDTMLKWFQETVHQGAISQNTAAYNQLHERFMLLQDQIGEEELARPLKD